MNNRLETTLTQLWYNFDTTFRQLYFNIGTTLFQDWDSIETTLGQFWNNFETTCRQFETIFGLFWDKIVTTLRQHWYNFETIAGLHGDCLMAIGRAYLYPVGSIWPYLILKCISVFNAKIFSFQNLKNLPCKHRSGWLNSPLAQALKPDFSVLYK